MLLHTEALRRSLSAFPVRDDVATEIAQKIALLSDGSVRPPTMSEQCKMSERDAVTWQAALSLAVKRETSTGTIHRYRPLTTRKQTKLDKATATRTGYVNRGLTLATAKEATPYTVGNFNACRGATAACTFACVGSATGQGRLESSKIARIGRTLAMLFDLDLFLTVLGSEIDRRARIAAKKGETLAYRANVASDHALLAAALVERHPHVTFYDYTAVMAYARRQDGVRRVYSRKDGRTAQTLRMLDAGYGVCVVFDVTARSKGPLPTTWHGYDVIDGDIDDLWFTRAPSTGPFVVGLRVKATTSEQLDEAIGSDFAVPSIGAAIDGHVVALESLRLAA